MSNVALANAALVPSSKNWKQLYIYIYSRWGAASKNKSKKPRVCVFTLLPCRNRCRISESGFLFSQVYPPSKIKLNKKIKTLRWRLLRWRLTLSESWSAEAKLLFLRHRCEHHSFQNHYTHEIIIFKLFRSLQLQFSGPTGINFRYSYSFVGLTGMCLYSYSSVQLHKKMVRGIIFRKLQLQLQLHKKWLSN